MKYPEKERFMKEFMKESGNYDFYFRERKNSKKFSIYFFMVDEMV